ncbi:MAG: M23 family metallopeptidase [Ilumatobacteraceae bacterium]
MQFVDQVGAISCELRAPISAQIVEVFREPACPWCPGKRGVVYATSPGALVNSGASGIVSFAGQVGGIKYVVVRTSNGVLVTHGYLTATSLRSGDPVAVGEAIGWVDERLYFGVRIDGRYIDPMRCMAIGTFATRRAVLIPEPMRSPASRTP